MNKYLLQAKGYFGMVFRYTVEARNKAEAVEKAKPLLEAEAEWRSGNVARDNYGGLHVVKKVQK